MDDIVGFGKAQAEAVLGVLDPDAQQREECGQQQNLNNLVPSLGQQCAAQQPGRVEQNHIHEIGSVNLHIAAGEGKVVGMKGCQDRCDCVAVCGTLPQSTKQNDGDPADKKDRDSHFPLPGF